MAYGSIKVDNITFTNGGVDQTVTVSGIVQSISGNITATGTIQGATIIGTSTVSGATVTGNAGVFTAITGGTAGFTTITGTTVTGTTANFVTVSGTTVTGTIANFGGVITAPTIRGTTTISGATITGTAAQFTTITGGSAGFTTVTGTTVSGTTANFATLSGTTITGGHVTTASGTYTGNVTAAAFVPTGSTVPTNGVYLPSANSVALATNGTGRVFVDSSGRVGVGTNSLTRDFVVYKSTNPAFHIQNGTSGTSDFDGLGFQLVGADASIVNYENGYLNFFTNSTERLRITSDGKVGVGTSVPQTTIGFPIGQTTSIGAVAGTNHSAANVGSITLGVNDGGGFAGIAVYNTHDGTYSSQDIRFLTAEGGISVATERVRITKNGRVGIGTTSPPAELSVTSGVNLAYPTQANAQLHINKSTGAAGLLIASDTISNIFFADAAANNVGRIYYDHSSDFLAVHTNNSERARIDSSGRLLVGTSSTSTLNTVLVQGNSASSNGASFLKLARGVNNPGANDSLGSIEFSDNGHINAAVLRADRDVGTWTSGSSQPTRLVFSTTADGASSPTERLRISNVGTTTLTSAASTAPFIAKISATEVARIDSSGRLLVGTSTDSGGALLQVNGDRIRVGTAKTPASATDTGTAGEICWDASYIYVCTATNTWKRTAIATW